MTPVLSRTQMRDYDKYAIETCHVPGLVLMENAGRGAADVIGTLITLHQAPIVIVCGAGNNGGDGFVVARHLMARGAKLSVFLAARSEKVTGDARLHHDSYIDLGGEVTELEPGGDLSGLELVLSEAQVVVDALFGTGLDRLIGEFLHQIIDRINRTRSLRVALDIPSGLDADSGAPLGIAVHATDTITFGHLKIGLLTPEGARLAGRVHVVDLGVPDTVVQKVGHVAEVIETPAVASLLAPREANVHKHSAGNLLALAGSPGKIGASLLVARGALRGGAGLVTIGTWPMAVTSLESRVVEVMTGRVDPARLIASIDELLVGRHAVVIGPGFGLDDDARRAVEYVVQEWPGTIIVDADALTHFQGRIEQFARAKGKLILTPHSGEMGRLLGKTADEIEGDRFGVVRHVVAQTGACVVLKGARTIVANTEGGIYINTSGNPSLATAGSGDVLAGVIGALCCVLPAAEAAYAGVHLHGLAADAWRARTGGADRGALASELADEVPSVMATVMRGFGGGLRAGPTIPGNIRHVREEIRAAGQRK